VSTVYRHPDKHVLGQTMVHHFFGEYAKIVQKDITVLPIVATNTSTLGSPILGKRRLDKELLFCYFSLSSCVWTQLAATLFLPVEMC
jgi:hypothetical protein